MTAPRSDQSTAWSGSTKAATVKSASMNNALRFVSYLGLAMPNFLLALMVMLFFTVVFGDSMTGLRWKQNQQAKIAGNPINPARKADR